MSEDDQAAAHPVVTIDVRAGGIKVNGEAVTFEEHLDPYTVAVHEVARRVAAPLGRAVRVVATEDTGQTRLVVHPDGTATHVEKVADSGIAALEEMLSSDDANPRPAPAQASPEEAVAERVRLHAVGSASDGAAPDGAASFAGRAAEAAAATSTSAADQTRPARDEAPAGRPAARGGSHADRPSFITAGRTVQPAGRGWRGAMNQMGLRLNPGPDERAYRDDVAAVSRHWPGTRTVAIVNGKGSAGKALQISEPVLTPAGYRPIGELRVGDLVIGSDGLSYDVLGVFPQGTRELYDVALTDGTVIRADAEHLWEVETANERLEVGECSERECERPSWCRGWCAAHYRQWYRGAPLGPIRQGAYARIERTASGRRLMTTMELMESRLVRENRSGDRHYFFIPTCQPVKLDVVDLPLDPYLLGLLLGHGSMSGDQLAFHTTEEALAEEVRARLPEGCWLRRKDHDTYAVTRTARSGPNPVTAALRGLGLWGNRCETTFVPEIYRLADATARTEILQGLLDTGGWVERNGAAGFRSASEQLADDVKYLAESLGCVVTASVHETWYTYLGQRKPGQPSHRLRIRPPADLVLFRLARKAEQLQPRTRQPWRAVHSVTPAGRGEAVCIAVASPDRLFLTRNCVPTHNTPTALCLAACFARHGGAGVLAWDNNETEGTMRFRTEWQGHEASLLNLLPKVEQLLAPGAAVAEMSNYVHHQPGDKYDVLWSDTTIDGEHVVSAEDVEAIHRVASRYYRMLIMDSGNSNRAPNWRAMVARADALVVPCTNVEDTAEVGARLLETLANRDEHSAELARNALVVVSQRSRQGKNMDRIVRDFQGLARRVVSIPYDPALETGVIRFNTLAPATQRAWLAAAAALTGAL